MITAKSTIKMNFGRMKELSEAAITALEKTAVALHAEIVQAQVVPREDGRLQGEGFFVDYGDSAKGKVSLINEGPYARRLYYHPEYNFHKEPWAEIKRDKDGKTVSTRTHDGNPNAKGKWMEDWEKGGSKEAFAPTAYKKFFKEAGGI